MAVGGSNWIGVHALGQRYGASTWRRRRSPDMDHFTWLGTFKGLKQILLKYPVMSHLVLGYMDDDHTYLKLGKVLLELQAAVDGQENIKFFLGERQKRPILKGVPASLMNGGDFVISEEQ